jgi:hypothetical protein
MQGVAKAAGSTSRRADAKTKKFILFYTGLLSLLYIILHYANSYPLLGSQHNLMKVDNIFNASTNLTY